jgi:hypothetical protein
MISSVRSMPSSPRERMRASKRSQRAIAASIVACTSAAVLGVHRSQPGRQRVAGGRVGQAVVDAGALVELHRAGGQIDLRDADAGGRRGHVPTIVALPQQQRLFAQAALGVLLRGDVARRAAVAGESLLRVDDRHRAVRHLDRPVRRLQRRDGARERGASGQQRAQRRRGGIVRGRRGRPGRAVDQRAAEEGLSIEPGGGFEAVGQPGQAQARVRLPEPVAGRAGEVGHAFALGAQAAGELDQLLAVGAGEAGLEARRCHCRASWRGVDRRGLRGHGRDCRADTRRRRPGFQPR